MVDSIKEQQKIKSNIEKMVDYMGKPLYKTYDENMNMYHYLNITDTIDQIKSNINHTYYKFDKNDNKILINNKIVLNTEFICHRINKISELYDTENDFGIEIDIRDQCQLILSHDPL